MDLHLTRSNPILSTLKSGPVPAVIAVSGPDGYVSPDWYGLEDQVPTWNYVAVHLRGRLERLADAELRGIIDRLSAEFEGRLPKAPWTSDKMTDGVMERMMRMIVPVRLTLDDLQSTWKLSQNKPDASRLGAAEQIGLHSVGAETRELAELMRALPDTAE